jgi:hypothetical protein
MSLSLLWQYWPLRGRGLDHGCWGGDLGRWLRRRLLVNDMVVVMVFLLGHEDG